MNIEELPEQLRDLGVILIGITAFLQILVKFIELFTKFLKTIPARVMMFLSLAASLFVPNGIIIWYYFYLVGLNSHRLSEVKFFLSMITQLTVLISLYAFVWSKWFYPKLRRIMDSRKEGKQVVNDESVQLDNNFE